MERLWAKTAFVGGSLLYYSVSKATFQTALIPAPDITSPVYTTLDIRTGIRAAGQGWRLTLFGRNATNTYYLNGVFNPANTRYAYAGLPATYGATVMLNFGRYSFDR